MQINSITFKSATNQTAVNNSNSSNVNNKNISTNKQQNQLSTDVKNKEKKKEISENNFFKELGIPEPPPITIGVASAAAWTGIGMLMDKVCSKILKYKFNAKSSFKINAIFGLIMGAFDYFRVKKS